MYERDDCRDDVSIDRRDIFIGHTRHTPVEIGDMLGFQCGI